MCLCVCTRGSKLKTTSTGGDGTPNTSGEQARIDIKAALGSDDALRDLLLSVLLSGLLVA